MGLCFGFRALGSCSLCKIELNSTGSGFWLESVRKPPARHFDSAEVYKTELKRAVWRLSVVSGFRIWGLELNVV